MDVISIRSELKRLKDKVKKTQKRKAAGVFTLYNLQVAACIAVILGFDFPRVVVLGFDLFLRGVADCVHL